MVDILEREVGTRRTFAVKDTQFDPRSAEMGILIEITRRGRNVRKHAREMRAQIGQAHECTQRRGLWEEELYL